MRPISFARTGVAAFTAAAVSAVLVAPTPGYAASLPMTLNTTTGPSGGGNILTGTINNAGYALPFPSGRYPTVQFQYNSAPYPDAATCRPRAVEIAPIAGDITSLTAGAVTVNPDDVRRLSYTKIAFTVPSSAYPAEVGGSPSTVNPGGLALVAGQTSAKWNVCVYDSDSPDTSTLLATSTYYLAVRPRIATIVPATAPTYGGQAITVTGAGFGPGTTASIDGLPITELRLAADGTSFTGVAPAHAAGTGYPLIVKTVAGPVRSTDPDNNGLPEDGDSDTPDAPLPFSFDDSLGVTPFGTATGSDQYLDVHGTGFDALTFDQSGTGLPTDPTAHVFLVLGTYDSTYNRGVQECTEVVVVFDGELFCRLDLSADSLDPYSSTPQSGVPVDPGDYTVTVVSDGSIGAADPAVGAGAAFTVVPS